MAGFSREFTDAGTTMLGDQRTSYTFPLHSQLLAVLIGTLLCSYPRMSAAQAYSISPVSSLGTLGGSATSYAGGVANGQITGYAYAPDNVSYHAFYYPAFKDLGTLGGSFSIGEAISLYGVAGRSTLQGDSAYQAFIWAPTGFPVIDSLGTLGGTYSSAKGISDSGLVTGYSTLAGDVAYHAFTTVGGLTDLGTLGGTYSAGLAINSLGVVVGYSTITGDTATHAFVYNAGSMKDLGTFGGTFSSATALNEAGQITGRASTAQNASYHAFIATPTGSLQDLGTLGGANSSGQGIGSAGQVVGYSDTPTATHAFAAFGGVMYDLNSLIDVTDQNRPYLTFTLAKGIRDSLAVANAAIGYVLALGTDSRTNSVSWYVLTLTSPPIAASSLTVGSGQTSTLSVNPPGPGPFTYQWFEGAAGDNSHAIIGATNNNFTTPALIASTSYWALVGTPLGTASSGAITVSVQQLAAQNISFTAIPSTPLSASPVTISASATSSLPVTFSSLTAGVCTTSGASVTLIQIGTCTIAADQAGNLSFAPAAEVSQSFSVTSSTTGSSGTSGSGSPGSGNTSGRSGGGAVGWEMILLLGVLIGSRTRRAKRGCQPMICRPIVRGAECPQEAAFTGAFDLEEPVGKLRFAEWGF
jgi:probable HAF family extracellular repeat protein